VRRLALTLVALPGLFCATARNYLDPTGPRFESRFGEVAADEPALRIVTFNIEHGIRVKEAVAGLLAHPELRGADVLTLQEMTAESTEGVARGLRMNAVYFPASSLKGHERGNAVLSPWPIEASWKVVLPHKTRIVKNSRSAVAARISIDGKSVVVYSLHLGSPLGLSGGQRREQAVAVLRDTERYREEPVIVTGDLNSHAVGEVFARAGFFWPTRSVGKSVMVFSFDHIFTRGLGSEGRAGVARELKDASDHRPVWAVLPPPAPGGAR
jgi:endonuclease/exonuclease/phosphatase (EEP) superfamily protein YafD